MKLQQGGMDAALFFLAVSGTIRLPDNFHRHSSRDRKPA